MSFRLQGLWTSQRQSFTLPCQQTRLKFAPFPGIPSGMWTETELPASWPLVSKDFMIQEVEWAYLLPFLHLAACSLRHHPNPQACLSSLGLLPTPAPNECAAGAEYLISPGNPVCAPNSTRSHQQPPVWLQTSSPGSCLRAGKKCSPLACLACSCGSGCVLRGLQGSWSSFGCRRKA